MKKLTLLLGVIALVLTLGVVTYPIEMKGMVGLGAQSRKAIKNFRKKMAWVLALVIIIIVIVPLLLPSSSVYSATCIWS